jgi:hypothetical protein
LPTATNAAMKLFLVALIVVIALVYVRKLGGR